MEKINSLKMFQLLSDKEKTHSFKSWSQKPKAHEELRFKSITFEKIFSIKRKGTKNSIPTSKSFYTGYF